MLRLRIAIADDAIGEAGDELGALLRKLAPSTVTSVVPAATAAPMPAAAIEVVPAATAAPMPADAIEVVDNAFVVETTHDDNDEVYHAGLRKSLTELIHSLCNTGLEDALDIARQERARRAEGGN